MSVTKEYKHYKEYAHYFVKVTLAFSVYYKIFVALSTLFLSQT